MKERFYCFVLKSLLKKREKYGLTGKQKSQLETLIDKIGRRNE